MSNVQVAVRVRPFNKRELALGGDCVVSMQENQTALKGTDQLGKAKKDAIVQGNHGERNFAFDHSFWSCNEVDDHFAGQEIVYNALGTDVLKNAQLGYNACIFAYGQTGSGKSYTMMGSEADKGIIPRLCESLFQTVEENSSEHMKFKVEVSYMEIYNERVRDLLGDVSSKSALRVREHRLLGPYVEGLTKLAVRDFSSIKLLMDEGNRSRTVASTNMNAVSSRSHAVFTINLSQEQYDPVTKHTGKRTSRINLVDLAGSERAAKTGASGDRLREGSNINKSLSTLGLVISALADISMGRRKPGHDFVPYRDSVLTWLLKDTLGGNSRTVMVATISPAADNYEETLSTLRYADRAKRIVNHAVINEDPSAKIIRQLKEEVERLRSQLSSNMTDADLIARLKENESLMKDMEMSWEERLRRSEEALRERQRALEAMGIQVKEEGLAIDASKCYMVNLNEDPAMSNMLVFYLQTPTTRVGKDRKTCQVVIDGLGIHDQHAEFSFSEDKVTLRPLSEDARVCVNGSQITSATRLFHGFRVLFGTHHLFRMVLPHATPAEGEDTSTNTIDWQFAQEELLAQTRSKFEEEKQSALESQRREYERRIQSLMMGGADVPTAEAFDESRADVERLKLDLIEAARTVREANDLCRELDLPYRFAPTVRVSPQGLSSSQAASLSAREIGVVLFHDKQRSRRVRTLDRFNAQLDYLREMYQRKQQGDLGDETPQPAYFAPGGSELIGVAKCFMKGIAVNMNVMLRPTIVNQDGRAAGELLVSITTGLAPATAETNPDEEDTSTPKPLSNEPTGASDHELISLAVGQRVRFLVSIVEARNLPSHLANFVFARYTFFGSDDEVMVGESPIQRKQRPSSPTLAGAVGGATVEFDPEAERSFDVTLDESMLDQLLTGSFAVQVWGTSPQMAEDDLFESQTPQRSATPPRGRANTLQTTMSMSQLMSPSKMDTTKEERRAAHQAFAHRWRNHIHEFKLWVQVAEVDDAGDFKPVSCVIRKNVHTGALMRLRHGSARRIIVSLDQVAGPYLAISGVKSVRIGALRAADAKTDVNGSFREEQLEAVKQQFYATLSRRRDALDEQIQESLQKSDKTEEEKDRENTLISEWMNLLKERDAVLNPEPHSGLPGAPVQDVEEFGFERQHVIAFMPIGDEEQDVVPVDTSWEDAQSNFVSLHVISEKAVRADLAHEIVCAWDGAAHQEGLIMRVTPDKQYILARLQVVLTIANTDAELVINKELCLKVYKRNHSFRSFFSGTESGPTGCGAYLQVVTSLPTPEDNASGANSEAEQTAMLSRDLQRCLASLKNLESIDRIRQSMLIEEVKNSPKARIQALRKRASSPSSQSTSASASAPVSRQASANRMVPAGGNATGVEDDDEWVVIERRGRRIVTNQDSDANVSAQPALAPSASRTSSSLRKEVNAFTSPVRPPRNDTTELTGDHDSSTSTSSTSNNARSVAQAKSESSTAEDQQTEPLQAEDEACPSSSGGQSGAKLPTETENVGHDKVEPSSSKSDTSETTSQRKQLPSHADSLDEFETMEFLAHESTIAEETVPEETRPETSANEARDVAGQHDRGRQDEDAEQQKQQHEEQTNPEEHSSPKDQQPQQKHHRKLPKTPSGHDSSPATASKLPRRSPPPPSDDHLSHSSPPVNRQSSASSEWSSSSAQSAPPSRGQSGEAKDKSMKRRMSKKEAYASMTTLPPLPVAVGDPVYVKMNGGTKAGVLRFYGWTEFGPGPWCGVELRDSEGKHNGTKEGVSYFKCKPGRGVFVRPHTLHPQP